MRRAGRPSWEIIVDHPQVLAIALYIRDATGIVQHAPPAELPEVLPPVARAGAASATTEETAEWNAWWSRALTTGPRALLELRPPSFSAFAEAPALHQLLQEHFEAARRLSDGPKRDHADHMRSDPPLLGKLVAAVERGLRRRAKPFTLRIDEVPVAGPTWLPVADGHVLVSPDLLRDPAAFFRELRPVIEELA